MKQFISITALLLCTAQAFAQYTFFEPKESFAIEVSLDNTTLKRLPVYRNAVSALAVSGDHILGGTSAGEGLSPFIFVASLSRRELTHMLDLGKAIPGQRSVAAGFCKGGSVFYAGTIANNEAGGHIMRITLGSNGQPVVKDLGIPVPKEGIFSLTANDAGTMLYGISYPKGIFFSYDVARGKVTTFNNLVPSDKDLRQLTHEYAMEPEEFLGKALVTDQQGRVYGSLPVNKLFRFDPQTQQFTILDNYLPEVWGRRTLGQVEAWARAADGKLYGGNRGDGQLFELDPATLKMKNLGKPVMMNRLRALSFARDGKLYGIGGGQPGYAHLFSYNTTEGFRDYGNPQFTLVAPGLEQGIAWRGFQIGSMAASADGKYVVMGEDEALSQLLIFAVEENK
ncbi:hypothetical protein DLD77_03710 [Chitinophaga alhagiae]|uniref:Uncharacterized protein n=1 Tax=Chitinophaga alhagiae TaxID=2203219 RepID=A0ABM6WAK6_9BACT|nr:hypothetical protein [Chitinophaga alhagiae]AWO00864.1 hypothetical protein DLD77_03710 [Chitinophaga alhagiae]